MIGVIISTHGKFSDELLRSAEMICGKQENVRTLTFESGESSDMLFEKYQKAIKELNTCDGILIMVDLFNGSPFNVALRSAVGTANDGYFQIITGVNMPMLIEVLMSKDCSDVNQLVTTADVSGNEGIRILDEIMSKNSEEDDLE